jgi:hypothetical protein
MVSEGEWRYASLHREQVIGVLKAAFVQGRLAKDEFDPVAGRGSDGSVMAKAAFRRRAGWTTEPTRYPS